MKAEIDGNDKPSPRQIFNRYIRGKLIMYAIVLIVILVIRYYSVRRIEFEVTIVICSVFLISLLILGYLDYDFYEKEGKKIISKLLSQSPLKEFLEIGFMIEEENKLNGSINDFTVTLSPLVNSERRKFLVVLIPVRPVERLEQSFSKFTTMFHFSITDNVIFARALINDYDKDFDFVKLFQIIDDTTKLLNERSVLALEIHED